MRIGIIDADLLDRGTKYPNLALMKLSSYYKQRGNTVELVESYEDIMQYDKIYLSKVFDFTYIPEEVMDNPHIVVGGSGFFGANAPALRKEIEHHMPDYDLYIDYVQKRLEKGEKRFRYADYLDYSIGFVTRGCFRKCAFCVNKYYDQAFNHSSLSEFLDESRPYIHLLDDNFLAYSGWRSILKELEDTGKPFQFKQGLDIRLMTEEVADRLSRVRYKGDYIFAFDHIEDRELIESKLRIWRRHTVKNTKLYVLCGYDSQDEQDIINIFERIHVLIRHQCLPYIMRHERYKQSKYKNMYIQLARWCNMPSWFKKLSFREYCERNNLYVKSGKSKAYKVMRAFEKEHPEIAEKYFDVSYSDYYAGNGKAAI